MSHDIIFFMNYVNDTVLKFENWMLVHMHAWLLYFFLYTALKCISILFTCNAWRGIYNICNFVIVLDFFMEGLNISLLVIIKDIYIQRKEKSYDLKIEWIRCNCIECNGFSYYEYSERCINCFICYVTYFTVLYLWSIM